MNGNDPPENVFGKLIGQSVIYLLEELETVIGRDESCDLVLESKSISKQHATIRFLDNTGFQAEIIDHTTRNGTFVNEERIWNRKKNLEHGDSIKFGYDVATFRFEYLNHDAISRMNPSLLDRNYTSPQSGNAAFFIPMNSNSTIQSNFLPERAEKQPTLHLQPPFPQIDSTAKDIQDFNTLPSNSVKSGDSLRFSSHSSPTLNFRPTKTQPSEEQALSSTMRDSYQVPDVQKLLDTRPAGMSTAEDRNRVIQTGGANLRSSDRPDIILPPVPGGSGRMGRTRRQRTDDSPPQWTVPTERPSTPPRHFPEPVRHTSASPVASQPLLLQPFTQPSPNTITINTHPSGPSASSLSPPLPTRKPIPRTSHPPTPPPTRKKKRKQKTTTHSGSSRHSHPSSVNISFPPPPPRPSEEEQIFFDDIRNRNRQTEIARARIEGSSKVEREAELVELHRQKVMEEAKERLRVELSMLTPDNAASDSDSSEEGVEREMEKARSHQQELDKHEQHHFNSQPHTSFSGQFGPGQTTSRALHALSVDLHSKIAKIVRKCLLRSEHGFEEAEARHKAKMDVGEEKQMTDMATRRLQKARLELTKCGAGGESVGEDYFDDSEEREEAQRQAVKERLKKEKETLLMETEAENAQERRRRAEKSAQKLSETLSGLQTDHSRLQNLHNTVVPNPPPSQPDAAANEGLLHDLAQLRRLLLHKQHEAEFLVAAMRDRIQNEAANTNNQAVRAAQRVGQNTNQFGNMSASDIVNTFVEQAEMNERLSGYLDEVVTNWKRVKTENKKLAGQSSFLSPNDPVPPPKDPLLNPTSQEDTITAMQRSLREKEAALKILLLELSGKGSEEKRKGLAMIAENERVEEERLQNGMKGHERERTAEINALRDDVTVLEEEVRKCRQFPAAQPNAMDISINPLQDRDPPDAVIRQISSLDSEIVTLHCHHEPQKQNTSQDDHPVNSEIVTCSPTPIKSPQDFSNQTFSLNQPSNTSIQHSPTYTPNPPLHISQRSPIRSVSPSGDERAMKDERRSRLLQTLRSADELGWTRTDDDSSDEVEWLMEDQSKLMKRRRRGDLGACGDLWHKIDEERERRRQERLRAEEEARRRREDAERRRREAEERERREAEKRKREAEERERLRMAEEERRRREEEERRRREEEEERRRREMDEQQRREAERRRLEEEERRRREEERLRLEREEQERREEAERLRRMEEEQRRREEEERRRREEEERRRREEERRRMMDEEERRRQEEAQRKKEEEEEQFRRLFLQRKRTTADYDGFSFQDPKPIIVDVSEKQGQKLEQSLDDLRSRSVWVEAEREGLAGKRGVGVIAIGNTWDAVREEERERRVKRGEEERKERLREAKEQRKMIEALVADHPTGVVSQPVKMKKERKREDSSSFMEPSEHDPTEKTVDHSDRTPDTHYGRALTFQPAQQRET